MTPTSEEVRLQLDRILASQAFTGADRARRFLRYVVERTLDGQGDGLKEFAIGVDVFDRGDNYDPRIDSIVRVEAGRLRARLEQYYQQASQDDAVVIQMRRGSYVPAFDRRAGYVPATPANGHHALPDHVTVTPRSTRSAARFALGALAIGLALAAGAWQAGVWSPGPARQPVVIAVLPFEHFSTEARDQLLAARVTDGVTSELVHQPGVSVVAHRNAVQFAESGRPIEEAVKLLNADVVVEGSLLVEHERVQVDLRLVDAGRGRKTWGRRFDGQVNEVPDLQRRVATAVAEAASRAHTP